MEVLTVTIGNFSEASHLSGAIKCMNLAFCLLQHLSQNNKEKRVCVTLERLSIVGGSVQTYQCLSKLDKWAPERSV